MGFLEAHADIISPAGIAVMLTAAYLLVRNLVRSWTRSPVVSRHAQRDGPSHPVTPRQG